MRPLEQAAELEAVGDAIWGGFQLASSGQTHTCTRAWRCARSSFVLFFNWGGGGGGFGGGASIACALVYVYIYDVYVIRVYVRACASARAEPRNADIQTDCASVEAGFCAGCFGKDYVG